MRYPALSIQEAATELCDFIALAVADREGPALQYPASCWFDAGLAAVAAVTAGWECVDAATTRFLKACDWYLASTGPLDRLGRVCEIALHHVERALIPVNGGCSESVLLPVLLTSPDGDHIIGLHMCAEEQMVHLVLLDSAPQDGRRLGLEQSCAMHLRAEPAKVFAWLESSLGEDILACRGVHVSNLNELAQEMAPWFGCVDWSPAAWAYHPSQVQDSCVPMMTQLAWSLEYAHPRMELNSRTQGHVQAGWTLARWHRDLCEMGQDLLDYLGSSRQDGEHVRAILKAVMCQKAQEISQQQESAVKVPDQLARDVFQGLASVSLIASARLRSLYSGRDRTCRHAEQCLKQLALHLSRLDSGCDAALLQANWLLRRWSRVVVASNGELRPLSDLAEPDRRCLNLIGVIENMLPFGLNEYRPSVRRWTRRILIQARQAPAQYPDTDLDG